MKWSYPDHKMSKYIYNLCEHIHSIKHLHTFLVPPIKLRCEMLVIVIWEADTLVSDHWPASHQLMLYLMDQVKSRNCEGQSNKITSLIASKSCAYLDVNGLVCSGNLRAVPQTKPKNQQNII